MTKSRLIQIGFLLFGIALFTWVLWDVDLAELANSIRVIGLFRFALILLIYLIAFLLDVWVWQAAIVSSNMGSQWLIKLFWIKLAAEAFNNGTPTGGVGGEPLKAILIHRYFAVGYREAIASLILYKTIIVLSLIVFLGTGFAVMITNPVLPEIYNKVATVGFVALSTGVILFFLIQRYKFVSWISAFLIRRGASERVQRALDHIRDMDERLAGFYTGSRKRFVVAYLLALANWIMGAVEVYYTMLFLGHPITMMEAVIIEVVVQLVRAGTFFIPSSIGVQEGTFLLVTGAISGNPTAGLAMGLVRRLREIIWIAWGFAAFYFMRPETEVNTVTSEEDS